MDIPHAVADFLEEAITLDNAMLPRRYAGIEDHALADVAPGWRETWQCIGFNQAGAPYFVDLDEEPDFPVYFAYHGRRWSPIQVADSLEDFAYVLGRLQDLEADQREAVEWLEIHTDTDNEVWGDVCATYAGDAEQLTTRAKSVAIDPHDYVYGHAVVKKLGRDPDAVVLELLNLGLGVAEIGQLKAGHHVAVRHDRFVNLRELIDQLTGLGAKIVFQADEG